MSAAAFPDSNGTAPEQATHLLRGALGRNGEECAETFASVLAEAGVEDTHWQLGNYEVLEAIGRGGMGVIYRARQRYSRRIVALKRVLAYQAESPETLVRFAAKPRRWRSSIIPTSSRFTKSVRARKGCLFTA